MSWGTKLRSVNYVRQIKRLQRSVNELNLDLQAILEEHDRYRLKGSKDEIMEWFNSLPIETLFESLDNEHQRPRKKYSLQHMKHKFALRKLHEKKKQELEKKQTDLNIAKIDCILEKIERVEDDYPR